MSRGSQRRLPGLFSGQGAVSSKGHPLLGCASPASPRPIFQDIGLDAAGHDPQPEALNVIVKGNEGLGARLERINRPLRNLGHVATKSPPGKQVLAALRQHNTASGAYWQDKRLVTATKNSLRKRRL
jgi:hypothetical protein